MAAETARNATNHEVILQNRIRVAFKRNIKDLQPEANIFVKNVPNNIDPIEFEKFFLKFGEVFSSRLNILSKDQGGIGYGYVQFDNKDSVQKCLENQKICKIFTSRKICTDGQNHWVYGVWKTW